MSFVIEFRKGNRYPIPEAISYLEVQEDIVDKYWVYIYYSHNKGSQRKSSMTHKKSSWNKLCV